jgi:hypothetical protein
MKMLYCLENYVDKGLIDRIIWSILARGSCKNAAISGFFEKNEKEKFARKKLSPQNNQISTVKK